MVCKMAKKGLVGLALAAGGLYLAFGTSAPSYVRTAFHNVRNHAKNSVSIQFDIDRAKDEIAALEPAILENREILARSEVEVEHLQREIAEVEKNLATEKVAMLTVRDKLAKGDLRLAKNSSVRLTEDEVKAELAARLDHYRNVNTVLDDKRVTLKAREKAVQGARAKLSEMANQKRALATKVEQIQARLQAIEATQEKNEFSLDDSALSRAKTTVAELEKRLEVKARVAEMEGRYPADNVTPILEGRDVLKEFDTEFGAPSDAPKPGGDKKSL
jgi:peptidoglycan hydrolase CwlO-like protein